MDLRLHRTRFAHLSLILVCLFLFTCVALAQPRGPDIVGGQDADPGEWPWQVALVQRGAGPYDGQFCGGTLIARDWVLTAAHCVDFLAPAEYEIVAGIHNLEEPDPGYRRVAVERVVVHPGWYGYDHDLALLQLAEPIDERPGDGATLPIRHVELVPSVVGDLAYRSSIVTGWGNTLGQPSPGGFEFPAVLQEVELPIMSNALCSAFYFDITDTLLCAGVIKGGKDSCQGDSGGPLVVFDETLGVWQQAGIVSSGRGCAQQGSPGVYTRVSSYVEWIQDETMLFEPTDFAYLPAVFTDIPQLQNGDFEQGPSVGWLAESMYGSPLIFHHDSLPAGIAPNGGDWVAWLGNNDVETARLTQRVSVETDVPVLTYYQRIVSNDSCGYDYAYVAFNNEVIDITTLCSGTQTEGWIRKSVDLSTYAGQAGILEFRVTTDYSILSHLFIDDVAFSGE
jgi:secreted trypsin-like serine protease